MELHFAQFITLGLFFVLLSLLFRSYWTFKKQVAGFPYYNILPYILYRQVTGKISKDTPLNNVVFEELVKLGKRHFKEGFFMTYASKPTLIIFSEEAIKVFANEKAALDKSVEYKILEEGIGAGLTTSNGERWRRHRKMINPAFNMGVLKEKMSIFNEHAEALIKDMDKLVDEIYPDILVVLKLHYFNALSESILGLKQGEETKAQIVKISEYVDDMSALTVRRFIYPWFRPKFLFKLFPSGRRFFQENEDGGKFINDTALNLKKRILSNKNEDVSHFGNDLRKSFIYILLKYHSDNPSVFTFEDLCHEARTMLVSGYDTVTYTTMWSLYLLGLYPEIQEKVYAEIMSTTSDYITYEECGNLTYLEAVILEALRLYPAVPIFSRSLSEDIQYDRVQELLLRNNDGNMVWPDKIKRKYKVLKGTCVAFFPYLSHRDPNVYPDPEKFEPERFLNSETRKRPSFIPFSEGTRSCIGKNYALMEMKIFVAHILRNFKFVSLDRKEDIKLCWTIILSPTKPLRFKITRR